MAKLFDAIEEEDLDSLPQALVDTLRAADAQTKQAATLAQEVEALKAQLAAKNEPPPQQQGTMTADQILADTRFDMMLMNLRNGDDRKVSTAVKLFNKQIRDAVKDVAPAAKMSEPFVMNVINMIIGQHMNEIISDIRKTDGTSQYAAFVETGSGALPSGVTRTLVERLTDDQKASAKKMGIDPEAYAKELDEIGALGA